MPPPPADPGCAPQPPPAVAQAASGPTPASHWDRLPRELHDSVLDCAGPPTKRLCGRFGDTTTPAAERNRRMWVDAFRTNWGGDLRALRPASTMRSLAHSDMWAIRSRAMHQRTADIAERLGLHLNGLREVALRRGWADLATSTGRPLASPALEAQLSLAEIQELAETGHMPLDEMLVCEALSSGRLDVAKWLLQVMARDAWPATTDVTDSAVFGGSVEMLEWLRGAGFGEFSSLAVDLAAIGGSVAVLVSGPDWKSIYLEWLAANTDAGATVDAMDYAAMCGHLDVIEWLHAHRAEGCTAAAMDGAASNGHLDVVRWLHDHRTEGCTDNALRGAAAGGHDAMVVWLLEHRTEGRVSSAVAAAAGCGHAAVVARLAPACKMGDLAVAAREAIAAGMIDVLDVLLAHDAAVLEHAEAVGAAQSAVRWGRLSSVAWLHEHAPRTLAAAHPAIDWQSARTARVMEWLRAAEPLDRADAMQLAERDGLRFVLRWIASQFAATAEGKRAAAAVGDAADLEDNDDDDDDE
ncbi:hypothetical protein HK105_209269 [Polyrhizophydium stewartii]|uniref:Ankyrin repeat domain-containing protein n=1 Tax=Polyrhizophydium stewartii TaxID=2732419 RepID=A0ABR4MVG4_9FUNG